MRLLFALVLCCLALPAQAQVEARSVALQNGCKPTKLDVLQQNVGAVAEITYTATCENKAGTAASGQPKTIKIRCRNHQCVVLN